MAKLSLLITFFIFIFIFFILLSIVFITRRKVLGKLYQPNRHHNKKLALSDEVYHDIYLSVKTGKYYLYNKDASIPNPAHHYINLWYFNKYPNAKTILYFHGNRYNISYREYMVKISDCLQVNLLLVDYRGYGRSGGNPSSQNVLDDAEATYKFLAQNCDPQNIIIWGESLGGSPACWVAANAGRWGKGPSFSAKSRKRTNGPSFSAKSRKNGLPFAAKFPTRKKLGGLILLSTFTSLHALLKDPPNALYQMIYTVARAATYDIDEHTNNLEMIKHVNCPVLIYHSIDDQLIPYSNAIDLISAAGQYSTQPIYKRLIPITGGHEKPQFTNEKFGHVLKMLEIDPASFPSEIVDNIMKIVSNISFASCEASKQEKSKSFGKSDASGLSGKSEASQIVEIDDNL